MGAATFGSQGQADLYASGNGSSAGISISTLTTGASGSFSGNWSFPTSTTTDSDATLKNTIAVLSDEYSVLFDNLVPCTYKYNDGTSDRLHIGFIAQEVRDAIESAELSTQDFAGYVVRAAKDVETGGEKQIQCLRYDEFIALNTSEIQKLKARVAELEEIIARGVNYET